MTIFTYFTVKKIVGFNIIIILLVPQLANCQQKIGEHFAGGIIFFVDSTGHHGEVFAEQTTGWFRSKEFKPGLADTIHQAGYSDWFVPSGEQLALIFQNVKKDRNKVSVCGGGTYWTSSVGAIEPYDRNKKTYALYSLTNGVGEMPSEDSTAIYPLRPIRKF